MAIIRKNKKEEDKTETKKAVKTPAELAAEASREEWLKIVQKPVISEKSANLNAQGVYVFRVARGSSKQQIAIAIKKLYSADAEEINTLNVHAKKRMRGRMEGSTRAWRKAMVKVKKGQTIELQ
jgi:large subunit ribosomal protein L23